MVYYMVAYEDSDKINAIFESQGEAWAYVSFLRKFTGRCIIMESIIGDFKDIFSRGIKIKDCDKKLIKPDYVFKVEHIINRIKDNQYVKIKGSVIEILGKYEEIKEWFEFLKDEDIVRIESKHDVLIIIIT